MSQKDDFQTIDPNALTNVSGGTTTTSGGSSDDQLMTALSGILDSVQQLGQNNQNQIGMPEMMMMMMMMSRNNQSSAAAAAPPWAYPLGYSYYY